MAPHTRADYLGGVSVAMRQLRLAQTEGNQTKHDVKWIEFLTEVDKVNTRLCSFLFLCNTRIFFIILIRRYLGVSFGTYEAAVSIRSPKRQRRNIRDSITALVTLGVSRQLAQSVLESYQKTARLLFSSGHSFPKLSQTLSQLHQMTAFSEHSNVISASSNGGFL